MKTDQIEKWDGSFGKIYTDRNKTTIEGMNKLYINNYGVTKEEMNKEFLSDLKIQRILEVGTNIGNQLLLLQKMGYSDLWGIEVSKYAFEEAKKNTKGINIINTSGFDIPFKDNFFDLVFTSGVLIHINPNDINKIMDEIYRVSKQYIFGFEYFSEEYQNVIYRGEKNLLWKGNFAKMFLDRFQDLKLVKENKYPYLQDENIDMMYLLKKQ